ncbi:MAG: hypothetical protein AAFX07_00695 [Pseudomonadota bacterium]
MKVRIMMTTIVQEEVTVRAPTIEAAIAKLEKELSARCLDQDDQLIHYTICSADELRQTYAELDKAAKVMAR